MVTGTKCVTLDALYLAEVERRGLKLSLVLNDLLGKHLQMTSSPREKLQEAKILATEAKKLKTEAKEVLTLAEEAEEEEANRLLYNKAEEERKEAAFEVEVGIELAKITSLYADFSEENVRKAYHVMWTNRETTTKALRAAMARYMKDRKIEP